MGSDNEKNRMGREGRGRKRGSKEWEIEKKAKIETEE